MVRNYGQLGDLLFRKQFIKIFHLRDFSFKHYLTVRRLGIEFLVIRYPVEAAYRWKGEYAHWFFSVVYEEGTM